MLYEEPLKDERSRRQTQLKFNNSIWDRGLKQLLHLGSKRAFNKTIRQTLVLEIVKQAVRSSDSIKKNE
jgi:hypothetical protein